MVTFLKVRENIHSLLSCDQKVLEVIHTMVSERQIMKGCRLLLSIDRRRSLDVAQETLSLYIHLRDQSPFGQLLGGIDFSGDARSNDAIAFIPILKRAQDNGIKLAVHMAEVPNEKETCAFLGATRDDSGVRSTQVARKFCISIPGN